MTALRARYVAARLLIPAIATLAVVVGLLTLGIWQLERKTWKEGLIATLAQRLAAPAQALPRRADWPKLDETQDEFRRVTFSAQFQADENAYVYAAASALRNDVVGIGYWDFVPARLADGNIVIVNRGFLPQERKEQNTREGTGEPVTITGVMRWPEARSVFAPKDDPHHNLWFLRDHETIAAAKGWKNAAPFYIEMEQPLPASGWPKPGHLKPNLPNNHLGYAFTWFGLAAAVTAVFAFWAWKEWREMRQETLDRLSL